VTIVAFFIIAAYIVSIRWYSFPPLSASLRKDLDSTWTGRSIFELVRSPSNREFSIYREVMAFYLSDHYWSVVGLLSALYVFLQAFAIPGPAIIAVLMAALFGPWLGAVLSMGCSLIGSSVCYLMFLVLGRPILRRFFPGRLSRFRKNLQANEDNLFFYFLFLRVTPILPNWFINISSGNLGIPFPTFFVGTLLGLIPNAIVLARAGVELSTLGETSGASGFDMKRLVGLLLIGALVLLPVYIKSRFKSKVY
jgi:uncharacterized membrane protein YdjX (TVP38/TMEM64 family)